MSSDKQLIVVRQLPIIEQRLRELSDQIDQKVAAAMSMVCTEKNLAEIRRVRADLNAEFQSLEEQRKAVKSAIMGPYNQFEELYRSCVKDKFGPADQCLKGKIFEVESGLKSQKESELGCWFSEYAADKGLTFFSLKDAGINVTLSKTPTALKKEAKAFLDRAAADVAMIDTMEDSGEIMAEYKANGFRASEAITTVRRRHEAIEAQRREAEARAARREQEAAAVRQTMSVIPSADTHPDMTFAEQAKEEQIREEHARKSPDDILTITFRVKDTRARLIALRTWLDANGYQYQ